jgi:hypothetical protein
MTIDEAMADLSILMEIKHRVGEERAAEAISLGIEALKRIQHHRPYVLSKEGDLLPGETENK